MTKAETYEQAWRLGFKGDFSQVDNLYHPEYSTIDHTTGIKSNLNDDKVVVSTLSDSIVLGAYEVVSESKENLPSEFTADSKIMRYTAVLLLRPRTKMEK